VKRAFLQAVDALQHGSLASNELELLQLLHAPRQQPHAGAAHVVQLLGSFAHALPGGQRYSCLVLERLGSSAAEVLAYLCSRGSKGSGGGGGSAAGQGMPTPALKNLARQLLLALDLCHRCCHRLPAAAAPLAASRAQRRGLAGGPAAATGCRLLPHLSLAGARAAESSSRGSPCAPDAPNARAALLTPPPATRARPRSCGVVHRDIKPGNVMTTTPLLTPLPDAAAPAAPLGRRPQGARLKAMSSAQLATAGWKVIDLGIACRARPQRRAAASALPQRLLQALASLPGAAQLAASLGPGLGGRSSEAALEYDTPAYAPPEAILQLPATPAYDMWSLGCLVYEMATGYRLFNPAPHGRHSAEAVHLYQMACLLGSPPRRLLLQSSAAPQYLDHKGALHMERDVGLRLCSLQEALQGGMGMQQQKARDLAAFLEPLLLYDPASRASARAMLEHPWLAS
jgi:serine/threonine-protein kinase SRPK3